MGPALLFYNDQTFSEKDLISITKIDGSHKKTEENSTGRFGQGFRSCYRKFSSTLTKHSLFEQRPYCSNCLKKKCFLQVIFEERGEQTCASKKSSTRKGFFYKWKIIFLRVRMFTKKVKSFSCKKFIFYTCMEAKVFMKKSFFLPVFTFLVKIVSFFLYFQKF
jgi:hypothetical protein